MESDLRRLEEDDLRLLKSRFDSWRAQTRADKPANNLAELLFILGNKDMRANILQEYHINNCNLRLGRLFDILEDDRNWILDLYFKDKLVREGDEFNVKNDYFYDLFKDKCDYRVSFQSGAGTSPETLTTREFTCEVVEGWPIIMCSERWHYGQKFNVLIRYFKDNRTYFCEIDLNRNNRLRALRYTKEDFSNIKDNIETVDPRAFMDEAISYYDTVEKDTKD